MGQKKKGNQLQFAGCIIIGSEESSKYTFIIFDCGSLSSSLKQQLTLYHSTTFLPTETVTNKLFQFIRSIKIKYDA